MVESLPSGKKARSSRAGIFPSPATTTPNLRQFSWENKPHFKNVTNRAWVGTNPPIDWRIGQSGTPRGPAEGCHPTRSARDVRGSFLPVAQVSNLCEPPAVCEFSAPTLRSDRRGAHVSPASAWASDLTAPPAEITWAPNAIREDTQVENLCYEKVRSVPRPQSPTGLAFARRADSHPAKTRRLLLQPAIRRRMAATAAANPAIPRIVTEGSGTAATAPNEPAGGL